MVATVVAMADAQVASTTERIAASCTCAFSQAAAYQRREKPPQSAAESEALKE